MVIDTESVVGYNNRLKQAEAGFKLGINDWANKETKKAGLPHMDGVSPKFNPPNSHPSNRIHKAAEVEGQKESAHETPSSSGHPGYGVEPHVEHPPIPRARSGSASHDVNKIIVIVGAVAIAALAFFAWG